MAEQARNHEDFSEVTCHHFYRILLVTQTKSDTTWEETTGRCGYQQDSVLGDPFGGLLQNVLCAVAKPGSPAVGGEGWEAAGRLRIHTADKKRRNEKGGNCTILMSLPGLRTRHRCC